jgi:hypothetical protein
MNGNITIHLSTSFSEAAKFKKRKRGLKWVRKRISGLLPTKAVGQ